MTHNVADLLLMDPATAAAELASAHSADSEWLDVFTATLGRERSANQARSVFDTWGINHSEAGRLFGVSRQAVSRWMIDGVPSTQIVAMADLAAATDILTRHLKRDRIPAVVRRSATALDGNSLIGMLGEGRTSDIVAACRAMFQFTDTHQ